VLSVALSTVKQKKESAPIAGGNPTMYAVRAKKVIYDYLMQCLCCRFIAQRQNAATADANAN